LVCTVIIDTNRTDINNSIIISKKEKYMACMLCGKRRIKPTRKYTSLGLTRIEHISEGICRECAWEKIKLKCKICGEVIQKGYPRLLAHTTAVFLASDTGESSCSLPPTP
jgi:ribosomal protein S27E